MGSDVWARWLTGLGVSVALISLVFGIWLQLETETSRGIGSYATTIRLSYALYSLAPFAMGLAAAGLGRILAALTARPEV